LTRKPEYLQLKPSQIELDSDKVIFVQTDVGNERSIKNLVNKVISLFGPVDIVLNKAAVEPIGAVKNVPIEYWDMSYMVATV